MSVNPGTTLTMSLGSSYAMRAMPKIGFEAQTGGSFGSCLRRPRVTLKIRFLYTCGKVRDGRGHDAKGRKSAHRHCLEATGARQTASILGGVALPLADSACKVGETDEQPIV